MDNQKVTPVSGQPEHLIKRFPIGQKLKICIVCIPNFGHMFPMSHVARGLEAKGHEIHVVSVDNQKGKDSTPKIFDGMNAKVHLTEGPEMEEFFKMIGNETGDMRFMRLWRESCYAKIREINPDLLICDLISQHGVPMADELKIQCIVHVPTPVGFCHEYGVIQQPEFKNNTSSCCGCICMSQTFDQWGSVVFTNFVSDKPAIHFFKTLPERLVLFNSFWGLDQPMPLPPNIIPVGPMFRPGNQLLPVLKEKNEELYNWMNAAHELGEPIVYVSIGTELKWQEWSVKVIYEGLKKIGCRVVWSLKGFELPEQNDRFFVRPWIPQVEVLAHPGLKAGLTHCGFGGTLEFISAGVPIVCWPHFGDQNENSKYIVKAGAGIELYNKQTMDPAVFESQTLKDPVFDSEKIYKTFNEALTDPKYQNAATELKLRQDASPGLDVAIKAIEDAAYIGIEHLIDRDMIKRFRGLSWCRQMCCSFLLILIIGFLGACTVLFWIQQSKTTESK